MGAKAQMRALAITVLLAALTLAVAASAQPGAAEQPKDPRELLQRGEFEQAAQEARRLRQALPAGQAALELLQVEVEVARARGDLPAEEQLLRERIAVAEKAWGDPQHLEVALARVELGSALRQLGQRELAAPQLDQAVAVALASAGKGEARSTELLTLLVRAADDLPRRRQAMATVETALPMLQGKLDPADPQSRERVRALLTAVAALATDLGRSGDALQFLGLATQFLHPDRAVNDPQTGILAIEYGKAWVAQGNLLKAQQFFRYAIDKLLPVYGADHPWVASAGRRLALVLLRSGDRPGALQAMRAALPGTRRQRQVVRQAAMPAAAKLEAYNATFFDDEVLFSLVLEQAQGDAAAIPELIALQLQRKGGLLQALLPSPRADDAAAMALRQRLAAVSSQLAQAWQRSELEPGPEATAQVQRVQRLRDQLQAQVAQKGLGSKTDTPADAGLAELCRALPQGAALVDFVHYIDYRPVEGGVRLTRKMAAVAVRQRDCRAQVVSLGDAKPVQIAVQEWRKALAVQGPVRGAAALGLGEPAQAAPWHSGAQALWGQLIAPVVDHLQGVEVLVISPDDALHFVPWPALMDPQGKLLAERWPVALVDSPGQLLAQRPQPGPKELAGTSALLIGGPAFGKAPKGRAPSRATDPCASLLSTAWAPLPGTLGEAKAAGEVLRKAGVAVETLTGAAATEAALRKAAPGRRWISLATHGYFAGAACARNADLTPRDPLLLSGLVFAGANQSGAAAGDDGWLTAAEIAALDLRGTQLVVLSACETGLGDAQQAVGEGVFGLRQAFARAGAAGVVLSLWQVPDRETAELMGTFWRRMAATPQRPWQALHAAQAELRAKLAAQGRDHPQLWAGFAYAGQP